MNTVFVITPGDIAEAVFCGAMIFLCLHLLTGAALKFFFEWREERKARKSLTIVLPVICLALFAAAGCRTCPDPVIDSRTVVEFVYPAKAAAVERPALEGVPFPEEFATLSDRMRENVGAFLRNISALMGYGEKLEILVGRYGEEIDRIIERERKAKELERGGADK